MGVGVGVGVVASLRSEERARLWPSNRHQPPFSNYLNEVLGCEGTSELEFEREPSSESSLPLLTPNKLFTLRQLRRSISIFEVALAAVRNC